MTKIRNKICDYIEKSKNMKEIYKLPYKITFKKSKSKKLKIAIVSIPCGGFGDVVFATKLYEYCKKWYKNAIIKVVTTTPKMFQQIGLNKRDIITIKNIASEDQQCVFSLGKFNTKKIPKSFKEPDLILSMLDSDEDLHYSTMKKIFKHSTPFNTFYSSEYNSRAGKDVRLPSGAGGNNLGLLLQKVKKYKKPKSLKHPYLVSYIGSSIGGHGIIPRAPLCLGRFLQRSLPHYKNKRVDVVITKDIAEEIQLMDEGTNYNNLTTVLSRIPLSYGKIILKTKDDEIVLADDKGKQTLVFRADILPLSRDKMMGLYEHSLKDILLTGDQSITDVLSCCSDKYIWYQIAPWKYSFAQAMAKEIPFKGFHSVTKACGKEPYHKPSYKKFIHKNDFRIKGKKRLDKIVNYVMVSKNNKYMQEFEDIVQHSRKIKTIKNKYCIY